MIRAAGRFLLFSVGDSSLTLTYSFMNLKVFKHIFLSRDSHAVLSALSFIVYCGLSRNSDAFPLSKGVKQGRGGEKKLFLAFASISRKP